MSKLILKPLLQKVEGILTLSNDEIEALNALPARVGEYAKGEVLINEGERPTQSFIILSGVTCMYKHASEGGRQILIFHFPGDFPDLQSLHLNVLDMTVAAVARAKVAFVHHRDIRTLYARYPRVGEALWRVSLVDAAILRERMLNLGQRKAYARIAHFLCEMVIRMKLSAMGEGNTYPLPFTQQEIGDALGLTNIHVNRIVQGLREDKMIDVTRGKLVVLNWKRLQNAADFDTTYLHLTRTQKMQLSAT